MDSLVRRMLMGLAEEGGEETDMISGSYTPTENIMKPSIDIGSSNFNRFLIWHDGSVTGNGVKAFGGAYMEFPDNNCRLKFWLTTNNGGTSNNGYMSQNAVFFVKSGSSVVVNTNQGSGAYPGYFVGGKTYQWRAWYE